MEAIIMFFKQRKKENIFERTKKLRHIWNERAGIFVGRLPDSTPIALQDEIRCGHVQIIGATGRGKTESVILPWLMRDFMRQKTTILIDGKGDRQLLSRIEGLCKSLNGGQKLKSFDLDQELSETTCNPLKNGSPQQITDRIFSSFEFEDPFYRGVQYEAALQFVGLISQVEKPVTFRKLYFALTSEPFLQGLVSKATSTGIDLSFFQRFTEERPDQRRRNLMGLTSQLAPFATGEISSLVNGATDGRPEQNISDTILNARYRQVVHVIMLPTLKYQKLGAALGKMLLQELAWSIGVIAATIEDPPFVPVYLDEFSSFCYKGFEQILNKARSSRVALHLSHQAQSDLSMVSIDFAKTVNTNTNVKCLLGLNDPDTADFFARHLGTKKDQKLTERARANEGFGFWNNSEAEATGEMSVRDVESYKVHPNDLKNFTNGFGVIHVPTPDGFATECLQFSRFGAENEVKFIPPSHRAMRGGA